MMANEHERTGMFTRLDWWDDAACRGGGLAMWVPITLPKGGAQRYGDRTLTLIDQARRTCATCPVLDRCAEWSRDKTDLSLDRGVHERSHRMKLTLDLPTTSADLAAFTQAATLLGIDTIGADESGLVATVSTFAPPADLTPYIEQHRADVADVAALAGWHLEVPT